MPNQLVPYLPYAIGRMYLRDTDDVVEAARRMNRVAMVVVVLVVFEALSQINAWQLVFYGRFRGSGARLGLSRAMGNCTDNISMGLLLLLALPWMWEAARLARAGLLSGWGLRAGPAGIVLGVIATVSRGPTLGVLLAWVGRTFFLRPRMRGLILAGAVASGVGVYFGYDTALRLLHSLAGETDQVVVKTINGKDYLYSGTLHRKLLYVVYADAMVEGGLFGHDILWRRYTPPDATTFSSVDNSYIHIRLQRGLAGLVLFDLLGLAMLWALARQALQLEHPLAPLAAGLFGAVMACMLLFFVVYCSPETAMLLYFTAGIAASMGDLPVPEPEEWDEEEDWDEEDVDAEQEEWV
jgi:hypothetical protein